MTAARRPRAVVVTTAAALAAVSLSAGAFIRANAAPAPAHQFATDQPTYLAIARAPFSDDPLVRRAPYSRRVLMPLAARGVGALAGGPERGFLIVTFATFAALPLAAYCWLTAVGASRTSAFTGAGVMALAPPVVGLFAWDPVRVDSLLLLLLFGAAIATVRGHGIAMLALLGAAVLTKESGAIGIAFALAWALLVDRRLLPYAAAAAVIAIGVRVLLRWWLPAAPEFPFDNMDAVRVMLDSLSIGYAGRRLLLATAGTWNLLVPFAAAAIASRLPRGRELALTTALAVAMMQLVFASDNERLVAAGYPFVLALCATQLDTFEPRTRTMIGIVLVLAQIPWLLQMGRVWPVPQDDTLPHFPPIRFVEIGIFLVTIVAGTWIAVSSSRR